MLQLSIFVIFTTMLHMVTRSSDDPNIIFIICDDIGYSDVSYNGAEYNTPTIDDLLENDAIILNQHYIGLSSCSPSRSMILTGRYAFNMGLGTLTPFGYTEIATIPAGVPTIANLLRKYKSYSTYALGKWHLGYSTLESWPMNRGFDNFHGFVGTGIYYGNKTSTIPLYSSYYLDYWYNNEPDYGSQNGMSTDQIRDDLKLIIQQHSLTIKPDLIQTEKQEKQEKQEPFFIYTALQAPHKPLQYLNKYENECNHIISYEREKFCQNILSIDGLLNEINIQLHDTNLYDNTLIIFTSDNGGDYLYGSCNYPYRAGKGTYFEGGIRTLTFMYGGYINNNYNINNIKGERNGLFMGVDWTPTLLSIANINIKNDLTIFEYNGLDGLDLTNFLFINDKYNNRIDIPLNVGLTSDTDNAIIFKYNNSYYKYILLTSSDSSRVEPIWCYYKWNSYTNSYQRNEYYDKSINQSKLEFLFDLSKDSREENNLLEYNNNINDKNDKNDENDKNDNYYKFKAYTDSEKTFLRNYALEQMLNYKTDFFFQDYLSCSETYLTKLADPQYFNNVWNAFLSWDEYIEQFEILCGDVVSDIVKELYVNKYIENDNNYGSNFYININSDSENQLKQDQHWFFGKMSNSAALWF